MQWLLFVFQTKRAYHLLSDKPFLAFDFNLAYCITKRFTTVLAPLCILTM